MFLFTFSGHFSCKVELFLFSSFFGTLCNGFGSVQWIYGNRFGENTKTLLLFHRRDEKMPR